jgi:hypothetical protein
MKLYNYPPIAAFDIFCEGSELDLKLDSQSSSGNIGQ